MAPGVGILADLTNAGISVARGNYADAALSMAAAVPIVGTAAGAGKIASRASKFTKGVPRYLYHYTSREAARGITQSGLRVGRDGFSYLTNKGNLTPLQAQIELGLPANRALPNSVVRVDTRGLNPSGVRRVQGNLPGMGAGGGTEFLFSRNIPASAIKKIR